MLEITSNVIYVNDIIIYIIDVFLCITSYFVLSVLNDYDCDSSYLFTYVYVSFLLNIFTSLKISFKNGIFDIILCILVNQFIFIFGFYELFITDLCNKSYSYLWSLAMLNFILSIITLTFVFSGIIYLIIKKLNKNN